MKIEKKQKLTKEWFIKLQNIICNSVEQLEKEYGSNIKFKKNKWKYGEFRTIEGEVIEKGGVAFSNVTGRFPKEFAKKIPGTKNNISFWSSGVSVVFHPNNPRIPAMHFNTRFVCTQKNWFGGGIDATPCLVDNKEKKYFHNKLKKMCNFHNKKYYPKYKKWCNEYFYLPHRDEARGIGGIFFDYKMDNWEKDFLFIKDVGITFAYLVKEIMKKKMFIKWTKKEKEIQLLKRGRYAEFNLMYDRGTKFGLNSGGNPEAILMSMPPTAKWK
jgi:coproporphyrinogen III oxidase